MDWVLEKKNGEVGLLWSTSVEAVSPGGTIYFVDASSISAAVCRFCRDDDLAPEMLQFVAGFQTFYYCSSSPPPFRLPPPPPPPSYPLSIRRCN